MIRDESVCRFNHAIPPIDNRALELVACLVALVVAKTERIALINFDLMPGQRVIHVILISVLLVYSLLNRL